MPGANVDPDDWQDPGPSEPPDNLAPFNPSTSGQVVKDLMPEIFDIICAELGWTDNQLLAWDYESTLGTCGLMDLSHDAMQHSHPIYDQASFASELTRLDLGDHHALGALRIDVSNAPHESEPTVANRFDAIRRLLPDYCSRVASARIVVHDPRTGDVLTHIPDEYGPRPPGNIVDHLEQNYFGMLWRENFFLDVVSWAVATVYNHADAAMQNLVPGSMVDQMTLDAYLTSDPIEVRDHGRNPPEETHCAGSEFLLAVSTDGAPEWIDATPSIGTVSAYHPLDGQVAVCGAVARIASQADFYWWWATRLYRIGRECESPWALLIAAISARLGLGAIIDVAGILVHEINHHRAPDHCGWNCIQGANHDAFCNELYAQYGTVPAAHAEGRWRAEEWTNNIHQAGAGCTDELYGSAGRHCALLEPHAYRIRLSYFEKTNGHACFASASYPVVIERVGIPHGKLPCF